MAEFLDLHTAAEEVIALPDLRLYICLECGYVSARNFRDDHCPICRVCMKVSEVIIEGASITVSAAPHREDS